jgi:rhodanese-related sulfurtransferase
MRLITREELWEKLERGDEFKLVMTLSTLAYQTKHIPTSLHFETAEEMLAALDPTDEIILYCADVHCAASIYTYRLLERRGYSRIHRYPGGVTDWEQAGYPLVRGSLQAMSNHSRTKRRPGLVPTHLTSRESTLRPPRTTPCGVAL